jgi:hypothetical protein
MNDRSVTAIGSLGAPERLVREHLNITASGDFDAVEANVTADYFNHRSADEPDGFHPDRSSSSACCSPVAANVVLNASQRIGSFVRKNSGICAS